tara:strand:+ start:477 stop:1019 length:543 start_codon:yes stop_codon:yes gene_type:complete
MSKREIKHLKGLITELNKINKSVSEELTWSNNQYEFFEKSLISANEKLKECEKKLKNEKINRKDKATKKRLKQAATIIKLKGETEYYKDMAVESLKQNREDLKRESKRLKTIIPTHVPNFEELQSRLKKLQAEEGQRKRKKQKSKKQKSKKQKSKKQRKKDTKLKSYKKKTQRKKRQKKK